MGSRRSRNPTLQAGCPSAAPPPAPAVSTGPMGGHGDRVTAASPAGPQAAGEVTTGRCPVSTPHFTFTRGGGERRLAPLWGLHPRHTGLPSRHLAGLQHCPTVASRPCFLPLQDGEPGARCVLTLAKATLPWTRFPPAAPPHLLPETLHPYEPPGVRPHSGLGSPWEAPVSTAQRPSLVEAPPQAGDRTPGHQGLGANTLPHVEAGPLSRCEQSP